MCGIVGYFFSQDELSDSINRKFVIALDAMKHRGPDDSGIFENKASGVGLGHTRLSIIDTSVLGHQPMSDHNDDVVLIFNGEIYNFQDLRQELENKGVVFRGHSDTEVLLNLYLAEGEAMLSRLNGIFAIALWDRRKQSILVARDALGIKPFYYSALPGRFFFASEIKTLIHLMPEMRELNITALQCYLTFLWCPGESTPLKTVRKLLPGEAMIIHNGEVERRWAWYQLPVFHKPVIDQNEQAAVSGTLNHLRTAVQRQMVADVPVGAFLSGGLDSSAIVSIAREFNPDICCFTIQTIGGQESGASDDLPYARRVAKHLGVSLEVVQIDAGRMADDLERMVAQLDEPLADPASLNVLYIAQLAREHDIKVLLSGSGGDDLFTGYRRHRALMAERWWSWLPQSLRNGLGKATSYMDQRRALNRRLAKWFSGASLNGDARLVNYFRWIGRNDLEALFTEDFLETLGGAVAEQPMLEFLKPLSPSVSQLARMLALEQRFFLTDHNLIYTDKMAMAAGVEVRVPFLDLDLVEFAATIPDRFKQRGKEGKWVLKKAMEPFLPHDVIYRPKSGFGVPLRRWMKYEFREMMGDLLGDASLRRRGLFDPRAVQNLIDANDSGRIDASYTLLSLLCIEIWCRRFIDNARTENL